MSTLFTTIHTDEGDVKIKQSDKELQKIVSLVYELESKLQSIQAKLDKYKQATTILLEGAECRGDEDCDHCLVVHHVLNGETLEELKEGK